MVILDYESKRFGVNMARILFFLFEFLKEL